MQKERRLTGKKQMQCHHWPAEWTRRWAVKQRHGRGADGSPEGRRWSGCNIELRPCPEANEASPWWPKTETAGINRKMSTATWQLIALVSLYVYLSDCACNVCQTDVSDWGSLLSGEVIASHRFLRAPERDRDRHGFLTGVFRLILCRAVWHKVRGVDTPASSHLARFAGLQSRCGPQTERIL
jgi:hypothetical protein